MERCLKHPKNTGLRWPNNPCEYCIQLYKFNNPKVDHDHKNGLIRGLLCRSCNLGLGFLKDSKENLESAIKYLESNLSNDDLKKCNWDTFPNLTFD